MKKISERRTQWKFIRSWFYTNSFIITSALIWPTIAHHYGLHSVFIHIRIILLGQSQYSHLGGLANVTTKYQNKIDYIQHQLIRAWAAVIVKTLVTCLHTVDRYWFGLWYIHVPTSRYNFSYMYAYLLVGLITTLHCLCVCRCILHENILRFSGSTHYKFPCERHFQILCNCKTSNCHQ